MENFDVVDAMMNIDFAKLAFATRIMNENLRSLMRFIGKIENSFDRVEINTKYGLIGIFSSQKDTINKNYFTSIDFGGDDLYTNNGGSNHPLKNHVGLLIDYSGNDIYESGFINSGILGLSWLIDFSGNDKYKNSKSGVAFSLFGASFFMDMKGDDVYTTSATFSQGSAIGGVSILIDQQGNDHYFCQNYSQGFGGTLGCGILIDVSGDDEYKGAAPDENDQNRFASFIRGAAYGRWAEATDGKNLAGGFGIFVDGKGTDSYLSRSFSQGAGYYFGIGMFSDFSGNDQYNATSHSQGYAAHFALGNFCDFQGDDKYNLNSEQSKITQIMGGGRDNSCGFFTDISGNDSYYFGNRSVGIGDMRGFGCFYDTNGRNEFYHVSNSINQNSPSIGKAVSIYNPASEFRLFSNRLNWNAGIYISAGTNNQFYSVTDGKSSVLNVENTLQIDPNQKELETLILKK
jgi:hypothetical protein